MSPIFFVMRVCNPSHSPVSTKELNMWMGRPVKAVSLRRRGRREDTFLAHSRAEKSRAEYYHCLLTFVVSKHDMVYSYENACSIVSRCRFDRSRK